MNLSCIYRSQRISYCSGVVRVTVRDIYRDGKKVTSAYVGPNTRIVYRSEAARMVWFIQMSEEMWHFDENGQVIFHKMINSFLPDVFKRWKERGSHHVVTIVLFTSVDVSTSKKGQAKLGHGEIATETRDYFRVVVDQVHTSQWNEIMEKLRTEFSRFDRDVLLQEDGKIGGKILPAIKGNLLQAISIASSLASKKFIDRDLRRTSVQTLILTPGSGIFDVGHDLMYQTSLKLLTIETGIDLICLNRPPLHVTPLFRYKSPGTNIVKHCVPSWLDISFWESTNSYSRKWVPRCKIYDIQMMGFTEGQVSSISIDYLPKATGKDDHLMEEYDKSIFKSAVASRVQANFDESVVAPKSKDDDPKVELTLSNVTATSTYDSLPQGESDHEEDAVEPPSLPASRKSALTSLLAFGVPKSTNVSPVLGPVKNDRPSLWNFARKTSTDSLRSIYNANPATKQSGSNYWTGLFTRNAPKSPQIAPLDVQPPPLPEVVSKPVKQPPPLHHQPHPHQYQQYHSRPPLMTRASQRPSLIRQQTDPKLKRHDTKDQLREGEVSERHSMWMTIANPSNVPTDRLIDISNYGRWQFVYPKHVKRRTVKWRTLKSPAALPLITNIFPSSRQFFDNYRFQIYDVMLYPDQSEYDTAESLLREIVAIRLSMGFQIVSKDRVRHVESQVKPFPNPSAVVEVLPDDASNCRIYMSMGTSVHRIACDDSAINIQMYSNRDLPFLNFDKKYYPLVKTQYEDSYKATTIDFFGSNVNTYNWNQIDHILTGFTNPMAPDQRLFRIRFVLVPVDVPSGSKPFDNDTDKLTAEELRLEGIKRFLLFLRKGQYFTREERKTMRLKKMNPRLHEIMFYTGSLNNFLTEVSDRYKIDSSEAKKSSLFVHTSERLERSIPLVQLAKEMQADNGVRFVDRRWHWKTHRHCFTGSEFVTWLLNNFNDIDTAEDAVDYGNEVMSQGLFHHVEERHTFLNGHYFYQLLPEYDFADSVQSPNSTDPKATSPVSAPEQSTAQRTMILLSRSLAYNVDSANRSNRPEILTFHLDSLHNPKNCFSFRLEWLNTTPKLIDETIISIGRLTEQYGLKLTQVPVQEISKLPLQYPFVSLYRTKLAIDLKSCLKKLGLTHEFGLSGRSSPLDEEPLLFHRFLLKELGYFLDIDSFSSVITEKISVEYSWGPAQYSANQYVHKSGMALAQVLEDGQFVFMPNSLCATRIGVLGNPQLQQQQQQQQSTSTETLRLQLQKACADVEFLEGLVVKGTRLWIERYKSTNTTNNSNRTKDS